MSKFSDKLAHGKIPTDQEWADHLVEAHKHAPGMTPKTFAGHLSNSGLNSYQHLSECLQRKVPNIDSVIDLACGDGYLIQYILPHLSRTGRVIGIDMSEAELEIARRSVKDPRVSFVCTKAQSMPVSDNSVDFVLCHMAFMLMLPIEPVVSELARSLKPGGIFSAVIGSPNVHKGLFGEIQKIAFATVEQHLPSVKSARSGDRRVFTYEGLQEIFNKQSGFHEMPEISNFELNVKVTPEQTWDFIKDTYFVGMLPELAKTKLSSEIIAFTKTKIGSSGKLSFTFPLRYISVIRL
jgi:ubiquinone/menaquinone biosynthesis C-methylase UbiE